MQSLDIFAEFSNQPATVRKTRTVENHIVETNKKLTAQNPGSDHIPDNGKVANVICVYEVLGVAR